MAVGRVKLLQLTPLILLLIAASTSAAPLPGGFKHSGWFQFEVIVLVDARSEVLESETWPLLPKVGYPARWRWLRDPDTAATLSEQYPDATVTHSAAGHTLIRPRPLAPPLWQAPPAVLTEGDLALIDELLELGLGNDTQNLPEPTDESADLVPAAQPDSAPLLPFEEIIPEAPASPLLALESLGLDPISTEDQLPPVSVPFAPEAPNTDLEPIIASAKPIPMPASFERLPLKQLAPGLARYRRNNEDEVVEAVSWLQGPGSDVLPILLEPAEDNAYPSVQGFVQLLPRGDTWRLGLNFWVSTSGYYLPDIFEMDAPPPSPARTTLLPASDALEAPDRPQWPGRHLIHIADTIPLAENRLRYFDHPVIKVLALWRELSWYELYALGVSQRDA